jgi:hypothetical protein
VDKFQYYLTDEDGKFYYLSNDVVSLSVEPVVLPQSPSGWQDLLIGWERNIQKTGIIRNFTLPLGFVLDGARIIRELFYSSNVEKEIRIVITKLNLDYSGTTFSYYYSKFYEGELDLSTFKDDGIIVNVNVTEGSNAKKLKANEGTPFEIPFENNAIRVKMDGIYLYQNYSYLIQTGPALHDHIIGTLETVREGSGSGFASFTVYKTTFDGNYTEEDFNVRADNFLAVTQDITDIHIKGSIKYITSGSKPHRIFLRTNTGREIDLVTAYPASSATTLYFDKYFDASAGENFFLIGTASPYNSIGYYETSMTIDFKSSKPATYTYVYKPLDFFKKLTNKVLGDENLAASTLLDDNANLCITCGDAVRGIEGAKIKTTLNNFFEAYNVLLNAGLSLESYLRIESKDYYFNTTNPIDLGEVKDLKFSVATDLMANTVKIGYPVQNTDDVNGKYAFNNTHVYTGPQTRVVKELALVCPYITDPFAIELYRINLEGKTTTDNSSDNEVMLLNVDLDNPQTDDLGTYYNLKRESYDTITGVPDPDTTFNIEGFTPKRLLTIHDKYINSVFYHFESQLLKFQTTEKNADLYTVSGATIYDENGDYELGTDAHFIPYYMEFDTQVPVDLAVLLGADQNRCVEFEWNGDTWQGYIMKAGIAPNDNKPQAFKVLLTPNNDLTRLI